MGDTTPRTAAGRELVEDEPRLVTGEHSMLRRVLAIEADAWKQGIEATQVERTASPEALDVAWEAARASLPDGWVMDGVRAVYSHRSIVEWIARATKPEAPDEDVQSVHFGTVPLITGRGDSPTAALRALSSTPKEPTP